MKHVRLEAEPCGQFAEDIRVAPRFGERRDERLIDLDPVMPVGRVQVEVFQLRGRGEDDVGVIDGVGGELLVDDGEQVVTH